MSITISEEVLVKRVAQGFGLGGLGLIIDASMEKIDVTYTVKRVIVNGNLAVAELSVSVGDESAEGFSITFEYDGIGDPVVRAEDALRFKGNGLW